MNKIKKFFYNNSILSTEKMASPLQMSLTLLTVICLILSNIVVVKSFNLFGFESLPNTCSLIVFPVTYMLSDVFSEAYGYRWSRITSNWAFLGTLLCAIIFAITIAIPGNAAWTNQEALVSIVGNTPQIAIGSMIAYWVGDLANDKVFAWLKKVLPSSKLFSARAIGSSLVGKYVDGAIFTMIGLSFLPMRTKLLMIATCPFVQICLETVLLPLTTIVKNWVLKKEESYKALSK